MVLIRLCPWEPKFIQAGDNHSQGIGFTFVIVQELAENILNVLGSSIPVPTIAKFQTAFIQDTFIFYWVLITYISWGQGAKIFFFARG